MQRQGCCFGARLQLAFLLLCCCCCCCCLAVPSRGWQGGGCAQLGRCCSGRSLACVSSGWRPDGSQGACYCDQACPRTWDCCHDYRQVCPGPKVSSTILQCPTFQFSSS